MTLNIWSLDEIMRVLKTGELFRNIVELESYLCYSANWQEADIMDSGVVSEFVNRVEVAARLCTDLELRNSHNRLWKHLRLELKGVHGAPTWGRVRTQLRTVMETLQFEMSGRRFAAIAERKLGAIEDIEEDWLDDGPNSKEWACIWSSFPSTKDESKEAAYCYALERNTACVFHSMRIAELGLRSLARRMRVKLPRRKKLEWGDWQAIIKEMSIQTDKLGSTLKAGLGRDETLDFYSGAIGQFNGFKDEFRNQVMHVRRTYDEFDALSAITRVRDFMYKLARKIDEKGNKVKTK